MNFNRSDLQQFTPEYISSLPSTRVAELLLQALQDLKTVHERLEQNPSNSSRPSSTREPWNRGKEKDKNKDSNSDAFEDDEFRSAKSDESVEPADDNSTNAHCKAQPVSEASQKETAESKQQASSSKGDKLKRKPGKQPGAQGFGRTQKLTITSEVIHKPEWCKGCSKKFTDHDSFQAKCGYCTVDIELPETGYIGLKGTYTKHIYGAITCSCGYETTSMPHRVEKEADWSVELGEWRLIGPTLLVLIVLAKMRLHLTLSKTQLLLSWLGITLSKGSISKALLEAGRASSSLEPELIAALQASNLLHVDETSWKEHQVSRWLWVGIGEQTAYFAVGSRSLEMAQKIIGEFSGNLMTDGYTVYRSYPNRLRCWAHLKRKAKSLEDSWDKESSEFGSYAMKALHSMMNSVYKQREALAEGKDPETLQLEESRLALIYECLKRCDTENEKLRAFAGEILNDQEVIFRVLKEPHLPLTNNIAEQALRPLVILRKISYGSKTEEGSRTVALLASITETLRIRACDTWSFFKELFRTRRRGRSPPSLPLPSTSLN